MLPPKLALLVLVSMTLLAPAASTQPEAWTAKVDPQLRAAGSAGIPIEFLLVLRERAVLPSAADQRDPKRRRRAIVAELRRVAERSQAGLLARIESAGAAHRSFWIANMIWVRGDARLLEQLARAPAVERVLANPKVRFAPPREEAAGLQAAEGVEDNLVLVGATEVWAMGVTGQGVVVGGADTGYRWDHEALVNQYRGWDGATANHAYNWHDAIHASAGPCGADSAEPCDDHDHGTHTMGIMVGDNGSNHQIGMAPGARWIGCRNMDGGVGTPATYTECFQWFLAPTDLNGLNPDPDMAPHVINNSWTCPDSEGCLDPAILQGIVETLRAAGIFVAAAAGNDGASCSTIVSPPAIYDASYTVGATDDSDAAAAFSSRGPIVIVGQEGRKPDVSAPGVSIFSGDKSGGYRNLSGTSMATPHVAGLVALLISANPGLAGRIDRLEEIISTTAKPLGTLEGCGGDTPGQVPNNTFGHGRIDALAAVELAIPGLPILPPTGLGLVTALALLGARQAARRRDGARPR